MTERHPGEPAGRQAARGRHPARRTRLAAVGLSVAAMVGIAGQMQVQGHAADATALPETTGKSGKAAGKSGASITPRAAQKPRAAKPIVLTPHVVVRTVTVPGTSSGGSWSGSSAVASAPAPAAPAPAPVVTTGGSRP